MTEPGGEPADPRLARPHPVRVLDGAVSYLDIRYATVTGWRPLTLDLHLPLDAGGPLPVVVYAHGGGFVGGSKEMGPWATLPACGIAVASVGYRLAGEVAHPGPVEDVLAAIRWVRVRGGEYGLDPGRVAGWGSSREDQLAAVSVMTAARRARYRPPVHLSHGDGDRRCGLAQSRRLHEVVLAAGGRSELLVVPGGDHADPVFATPAVVDPAVEFLRAAWARHDPLE
ncbi:alpha/beta hydrolase [Amycolatopsis thermoflava]|uniref:Alpha/beta hydrolase family protein n=1 Tax=Amycolatopsis thermoflava TaxID=84480 RepID=A0A3N2H6L0_9PSEU|nr:alpha/beta hydrolase [Amycolatopsis thermoflava]ROS44554.1 alpha/beta hydrolase family protein [Amycolatopsis thermoflava]